MTDEQKMEVAIKQAEEAKRNGEWPFGAAIFQGDTFIAKNRCREAYEKTVLAHAELHAVKTSRPSIPDPRVEAFAGDHRGVFAGR